MRGCSYSCCCCCGFFFQKKIPHKMFEISCMVVILLPLIHIVALLIRSALSALGGKRGREGGKNLDKSASMVY